MEQLAFRITGTSPLLMNNPAKMKRGSQKPSPKKIPTPEDEAEAGVYRLDDEQLYIPAIAFRAALINSGKGRRVGRRGASAVLQGSVFLLDEFCPLTRPDTIDALTEYEIDVRRAVVQRQGVMRARPRINEWQTTVAFEYDPDFISTEILEEGMTIAGRIVGVLDYRPDRGGWFGRFDAEVLNGNGS